MFWQNQQRLRRPGRSDRHHRTFEAQSPNRQRRRNRGALRKLVQLEPTND